MNVKGNIFFIGLMLIGLTMLSGQNKLSYTSFDINPDLELGEQLKSDPSQFVNISGVDADFETLWNSPVKIVAFLRGGCSMCSFRFSQWDSFIETYAKDWEIPVIIIAYDPSLPSLKYSAQDNAGFKHPIFFDKTNSFYLGNNLSADIEKQAFLVGNDDEILVIGSPIENKKWTTKYKNKLKKVKR